MGCLDAGHSPMPRKMVSFLVLTFPESLQRQEAHAYMAGEDPRELLSIVHCPYLPEAEQFGPTKGQKPS